METAVAVSGAAMARLPMGRARHGRRFHRLLAGLHDRSQTDLRRVRSSRRSHMRNAGFNAIASVARKEFLHIVRDRRVLLLLLILPPVFTIVFGHAFEAGEMTEVPALLINRDQSERADRFLELIRANKTFAWQTLSP